MRPAIVSLGTVPTLGLCFVACLIEGADIVSMGLVAPVIARQFGFGPAEMGYVLTAAIVGLMVGAATGGMLGDRWGRRVVVIVAFAVLGLCSILTAHADSLTGFLLVRFLCGIGLGAALPNLIAIAAEAARPGRRATAIGLMFAGQPAGGSLLGLFVASRAGVLDWTSVFYIGGVLPLLLLPVLILALPEPEAFRDARSKQTGPRAPTLVALFGEGRAAMTLLMWASYGFTQVVVYLINNWLPTLMVAKGFSAQQAGAISSFENAGAVAGCIVLAMATDRGRVRPVLMVTYVGIVAGLFGLAMAQSFWPVVAIGIAVGFFVIGGQLILYTLAPSYYPILVRATGTGAAVSVGRLGGIFGPLAAGKLMAIGLAPAGVLIAAVPCALLAGLAAVSLTLRPLPAE
ncbi:MFS transporter [Sphingomonas sp. So64.6b]|uniref:MFS transporter n=1 Tax=Sphingomonas sp. So64.6b TaxID=2997354 RepID=UPI001FCF05AC|nr:MFS transporter [Sphingomonas sp. So64.6b]